MKAFRPAVIGTGKEGGILSGHPAPFARSRRRGNPFPVQMGWNLVVVQRAADAEVIEHVISRLRNIESVFPVESDAVAVNQLKHRDGYPTGFSEQLLVVEPCPVHTGQAFKKIAVGNRPLTPVFASENAKHLARVVGDRLLPFHVVGAHQRVSRIGTFLQA